LTWDKVDLDEGIIRLSTEDTKTNRDSDVPLNDKMVEMLRQHWECGILHCARNTLRMNLKHRITRAEGLRGSFFLKKKFGEMDINMGDLSQIEVFSQGASLFNRHLFLLKVLRF